MRTSPLTRAASGAVGRPGPDVAGVETGDRRQRHAGLAERRQHVLDVAEEQRVGTDDEHTLALEREPVRVEEVGGAMQGDRRLAGAGAALDDEHAGHRRADDVVLLRLDRADDVAHGAGAAALQRRQQRALAGERRLVGQVVEVEELVLHPDDAAPVGDEVAAPGQPHRVAAGRPVERLGDGRAPVDDQRLLVDVGHGQATDVEALARRAVDPPEAQRLVAQAELLDAGEGRAHDHVALLPGLVGAAPAVADHLVPSGRCGRPHRIEAGVGPVDVGLFALDVAGFRHVGLP